MGKEPEQIERELERTREKLDHDLSALEEKVHPRKVVERGKERAREKATEAKERAMGAVGMAREKVANKAWPKVREPTRRNPALAGGAAFLLGWLLSQVGH